MTGYQLSLDGRMECSLVNLMVLQVCTNSPGQLKVISHSESSIGAEDIVFAASGDLSNICPSSVWEQTGKHRIWEVPDMLLVKAMPGELRKHRQCNTMQIKDNS